jgi:hypothetical protein
MISEILASRNYKKLYSIDEDIINRYFFSLCESDTNKKELAVLANLCNWLDYENALVQCAAFGNKKGFKVIMAILSDYVIDATQLIYKLITNADEHRYYIGQLITAKMVAFGDVFEVACQCEEIKLIEIIIKFVEPALIRDKFEYYYVHNPTSKLLFLMYSNNRYSLGNLGPCKTIYMLRLIRYEECYTFNEQLKFIVANQDYQMLEVLAGKITGGRRINVEYESIQPILDKMPDSLLRILIKKFKISTETMSEDDTIRMAALSWDTISD